jgi:hypothetical protein
MIQWRALYKRGDAALNNNHRPLNHQSHSVKFAERIHAALGKPHLNRILTNDHFGSRQGWGMDLEILVLRDDIDDARLRHLRQMYISTDVGGAFDDAFRQAIREVHMVTGYPTMWRQAREELWRGMKATLWLDGYPVGDVEWKNGTLQGGVESGDDYLALTVYQHARIDQQTVTKTKVRQRYFADDAMYILADPKEGDQFMVFLDCEYADVFMVMRAHKIQAAIQDNGRGKRTLKRILVPVARRPSYGPDVATPELPKAEGVQGVPCQSSVL